MMLLFLNRQGLMNFKKAFTLSEVMLVLSVIGVIAALTIPGIVQNTQDRLTKVRWKKAYSQVVQAVGNMKANGTDEGAFATYILNARSFYPAFKGYIKVLKDSGFNVPSYEIKQLNGTVEDWHNFDDGNLALSDGSMVYIENPDCGGAGPNCRVLVWVDINGSVMPNTIGKDIFGVKVYPDGMIKPMGLTGDGYENTCVSTSTGWGCGVQELQ